MVGSKKKINVLKHVLLHSMVILLLINVLLVLNLSIKVHNVFLNVPMVMVLMISTNVLNAKRDVSLVILLQIIVNHVLMITIWKMVNVLVNVMMDST